MEVVVTTVAISRPKLQTNHHQQQTNIQFFHRPDALPVTQPTVSKHCRLIPLHIALLQMGHLCAFHSKTVEMLVMSLVLMTWKLLEQLVCASVLFRIHKTCRKSLHCQSCDSFIFCLYVKFHKEV